MPFSSYHTGWLSFLYRLFNAKPSEKTYTYVAKESDREIEENSIEDSQGDGLVLFDDPLFPEEFDEDEDEE